MSLGMILLRLPIKWKRKNRLKTMAFQSKKHLVSDPAFYGPLIADQKKRTRKYSDNAKEWLELGRLHEARIDMTKAFAGRVPGIRYFIPIYISLLLISIVVSTRFFPDLVLSPTPHILVFSISAVLVIFLMVHLWFMRYPSSGKKYFEKAVRLDPLCAEAYVYLGLIALRRHQKRRGCLLLEKSLHLNGDNKKIERELKSIYEKEFMAFFSKKSQKEIRQEEIIDRQREEIRELRSMISSLETLTERLSHRAGQAKWETGHKARSLSKEMAERISAIRKEHETEIAAVRESKESLEEAKALAQRDFMRLTTEIVEAKAELEGRSLDEASKRVKDIMGSQLWNTLLEQTRTYLATAEHTFNLFMKNEDDPDYSLVGMELCKALETEINRSLVRPFPEYLNGNKEEFLNINQIGETKGKPLYFTYLAKVVDRQNFPEITTLTLGQFHFVLKRALDGDYALKEYGDFLDQIFPSSKNFVRKDFLKKLKIVTSRYRNTIAHESPMNKKQCNHLRKLIFAGNDALLKTCPRIGQFCGIGVSSVDTALHQDQASHNSN